MSLPKNYDDEMERRHHPENFEPDRCDKCGSLLQQNGDCTTCDFSHCAECGETLRDCQCNNSEIL